MNIDYYTFEDFLEDASPEQWDEWEQTAADLELPLDYYLQEFVVLMPEWEVAHRGLRNAHHVGYVWFVVEEFSTQTSHP